MGKRMHQQRQEDNETVHLTQFVNERRNKLCDSLSNAEQDRYAAHLEAFGHKKNWNPVVAVENVSRL